MGNLNDNVDSKGRKIWIKLTEKDSPYYGRNYDALFPLMKEEHDRYVRGEISIMNLEVYFEMFEDINKEIKSFRLDFINKMHQSELASRDIIINS